MNITILNLCNTCNSVYWNSEPCIWVKHPDGYIYLVNQNTKEIEFRLKQNTTSHHNEAIMPILNKVGQLLSIDMIKNIFVSTENKLDLRKIMDEQKILLIRLPK